MQNRLSIRQKYSRCNPEADDELYQSANFLLLPEAFVFVACLTLRAPLPRDTNPRYLQCKLRMSKDMDTQTVP